MAVTRIKTNQITDSAVTTAKIADVNVTAGKLEANLTYGSNLTVTGNLTVNGSTTTVDTTNTTVADPFMLLGSGGAGNVDGGIIINRGGAGNNAAMIWDESEDQFAMMLTTDAGTTAGNVTIASYGDIRFGTATGALTGNVTGNVVGNVTGTQDGVVGGNTPAAVTGTVITANTNFAGALTGNVTGNVAGNLTGNVTGTQDGVVGGNTPAAVTGTVITANTNFAGDITGDVTGDVAGNLTGNSAGAHTGAVDGIIGGTTPAAVTGTVITASTNFAGNITGNVTGNVAGNVTGNVTGTQDGVVGGNTPAAGTFTTITAGGTIDAGSNQVTNVTDPTANQHAATKAYVDSQLSGAANAINQLNSDVTVTDSGSNGLITFNIDGASEGTINSDGLTMGNINIDANTIKTTSGNLTIDPNPGGSGGTVTIEGSLTVTGTTTTVDSTVVTIADPVFQVGADSNDNLDRGITYLHNDGSAKKGYFGLDTSATEFVFIADATDTSSVFSGDLGAAAFGSMRVADLTNTRVTFSGANGELSDAASLTFNSGTGALSATSFVGALTGNVTGNSAGAHTGAVDGVVGGNTPAAVTGTVITANTNFVGDITGDVTGDVAGNLTGNSAGVHTGAVSGDVTSTGTSTFATVDVNGGAIDGAIIGANTAAAITGTTVNGTVITASTNFAGNITGNVTGNVAGNVTGTQDGVVGGNTPAAVTGTVITANTNFAGNITGDLTGDSAGAHTGAVDGVLGGNTPAAATVTTITASGNSTNAGTLSVGGTSTVAGSSLVVDSTDSVRLPVGTTAQRPASPSIGQYRFNSTSGTLEVYTGGEWNSGADFTTIAADAFNGDASTVAFTLSVTGTTATTIVSLNGVVQIPTTAYAVSGTTLTFTEAPATGDVIDARVLTTTSTIVGIADQDGDTQIQVEEGTDDDTIRFDAAGTEMFTINSSGIAGASGARITAILDEDAMGSDSATALATQQSIKAYVTSQIATKDNTDEMTEGSTNLYFTNARADARAQAKIDSLVDSAPGALDTLNELAAALGDDANFSGTVTSSLATKMPLAGGTFTGDVIAENLTISGSYTLTLGGILNANSQRLTSVATPTASSDAATKGYVDGGLAGLSQDSISEGDSKIEVTDSGTGTAVVTLDNAAHTTFNSSGITLSTGVFSGTATSAQYADLAEMYSADADIEPGTVVCFGGEHEVTTCMQDADKKIAGVVSTNPAYLMNSDADGVAVALQGRVPCKVTGAVAKGDMLVAAGNGMARAEENPAMGTVIGKALENHAEGEGVIEVVVGRM